MKPPCAKQQQHKGNKHLGETGCTYCLHALGRALMTFFKKGEINSTSHNPYKSIKFQIKIFSAVREILPQAPSLGAFNYLLPCSHSNVKRDRNDVRKLPFIPAPVLWTTGEKAIP